MWRLKLLKLRNEGQQVVFRKSIVQKVEDILKRVTVQNLPRHKSLLRPGPHSLGDQVALNKGKKIAKPDNSSRLFRNHDARLFSTERAAEEDKNFVSWGPPEAPTLKLDVDVSFKWEEIEANSSVGGSFRNSKGEMRGGFLGMISEKVITAATVEYFAVVEGLKTAARKDFLLLEIGIDSAEVAGSLADYFNDPDAFVKKLKKRKGGGQTVCQKIRLECLSRAYDIVKSKHMSVSFVHVPRATNQLADFLSKLGYQLRIDLKDFDSLSDLEGGNAKFAEEIRAKDAIGVKYHKKSKLKLPWSKENVAVAPNAENPSPKSHCEEKK